MKTNQASTVPWGLTAALILLFVISLAGFLYGNYQAGSEAWQLVVNALLTSIPLTLLYFSAGLLIAAGRQKRSQSQISERLAKFVYRTPRIAGIIIAIFVGLFSLDVFTEEASFWQNVVGFLIHSLPSIVMAVILVLAWRRPWIGFFAFLTAAILFLIVFASSLVQSLGTLLLFSGPMAAIAMLFWANWKWLKPPAQKLS